jgi:hypothetical protein
MNKLLAFILSISFLSCHKKEECYREVRVLRLRYIPNACEYCDVDFAPYVIVLPHGDTVDITEAGWEDRALGSHVEEEITIGDTIVLSSRRCPN